MILTEIRYNIYEYTILYILYESYKMIEFFYSNASSRTTVLLKLLSHMIIYSYQNNIHGCSQPVSSRERRQSVCLDYVHYIIISLCMCGSKIQKIIVDIDTSKRAPHVPIPFSSVNSRTPELPSCYPKISQGPISKWKFREKRKKSTSLLIFIFQLVDQSEQPSSSTTRGEYCLVGLRTWQISGFLLVTSSYHRLLNKMLYYSHQQPLYSNEQHARVLSVSNFQ